MTLRAFRPRPANTIAEDAKKIREPMAAFQRIRRKRKGSAMQNLLGNLRYVLRQFRLSPVFTVAAMLTLALGIGGTTAIFTLIHAVMLRSLPVGDPAALYRIGEGDDCCVEGGPQDQWGMFSYPLSERLKAETPEFEQ